MQILRSVTHSHSLMQIAMSCNTCATGWGHDPRKSCWVGHSIVVAPVLNSFICLDCGDCKTEVDGIFSTVTTGLICFQTTSVSQFLWTNVILLTKLETYSSTIACYHWVHGWIVLNALKRNDPDLAIPSILTWRTLCLRVHSFVFQQCRCVSARFSILRLLHVASVYYIRNRHWLRRALSELTS